MSVVICYTCDFFSMIATDTRISYGWGLWRTVEYDDDNIKLYNVKNMGWIAGAGAHSFIDILKCKLDKAEIMYNDQVKHLFMESYNEAEQLGIYDKEVLDITGIAASWIAFNPEISPFPIFRVGIFSSKTISDEISAPILEKNEIFILFPYEYIKDIGKIDELKEKYPLGYVFDGDYNKFIHYICCIFKEIASNSGSVSNTCDIGIMNIDNSGINKIQIKDNVDHLTNDYVNQYKNTEFNTVWSFQFDNVQGK